MTQHFFILSFIIFSYTHIFGQSTSFVIEELEKSRYEPYHTTVRDIMTDNRGYLWIGDSEGLRCYDGYRYIEFDHTLSSPIRLSNSDIRALAEDTLGNFYVATSNGLNVINFREKSNEIYLGGNSPLYSTYSLNKGVINDIIVTTRQKVWIVGGAVLGLFSPEDGTVEWKHEEKISSLYYLKAGKNHDFWAITNKNGIFHLDEKGTILNYYPSSYLNKKGDSLSLRNCHPVEEKETNNLLLYSPYQRINSMISTFNPQSSDMEISQNQLFKLQLQNIFDFHAPPFQETILYDAYMDPLIYTVHYGKNNIAWFGGELGLFKIKNNVPIFNNPKELSGYWINKILEVEDELYITTISTPGLFSYNKRSKEVKTYPNINSGFDLVKSGEDTLLISSQNDGIYLFHLKQKKIINQWINPDEEPVFNLIKDIDGNIWFNSWRGIYRFDLTNFKEIKFSDLKKKDSINFNYVNILGLNNNRKLLISSQRNIMQISEAGGIEKTIDFTIFPTNNDLWFRSFFEDTKGNYWLGTHSGLFYFDPKNKVFLKRYSKKNGLLSDKIHGITSSQDSILWLSTPRGLSRFEVNKERFINFNQSNGLVNNQLTKNATILGMDDKLYLGSIGGLSILDLDKLKESSREANRVLLPRIIKNNGNTSKNEEILFPLLSESQIVLNPQDQFVQFFFSDTDFTDPSKNQFQYQLIGFDSQPINTKEHSVRYTNLNSGNYTFKVKSLDAHNNWSENEIEIELIVKEVFYKRAWFIVVIFFGMLFLIIVFFRYRLNQRERIFKIRQKIADDLHDNVSNSLSYIRLVAKNTNNGKKELSLDDTNQIIDISSKTLHNIRETIWLINPKNTSLSKLIIRMEELLSQLFDKEVNISFKKIGFSQDKKIDFIYQRNVWLIFKEAVSNIVKHTNATEVSVILDNRHNKFKMIIINKYQTKHHAEYSTNKGLLSMQRRAKELKGTIEINEGSGQFQLILWLNKAL